LRVEAAVFDVKIIAVDARADARLHVPLYVRQNGFRDEVMMGVDRTGLGRSGGAHFSAPPGHSMERYAIRA